MKKTYTIEYYDNRDGKQGKRRVTINYTKTDDPFHIARMKLSKQLYAKNWTDIDVRRIY